MFKTLPQSYFKLKPKIQTESGRGIKDTHFEVKFDSKKIDEALKKTKPGADQQIQIEKNEKI